MNLAILQKLHGKVITIEADSVLDLNAFQTFLSASSLANTTDSNSIEVDLEKTRQIRDSGLAMLQLLRKRTRWSCPIRFVNWDPVVHGRLAASRIGTQFQFTS